MTDFLRHSVRTGEGHTFHSRVPRYRFRVISPKGESAFGTTVELYDKRFAVLRVKHPDSADAAFYSRVQEALGVGLVLLHPDQELELVEVVEREAETKEAMG